MNNELIKCISFDDKAKFEKIFGELRPNLSETDENGDSYLHFCAKYNSNFIAKLLVEMGANVNLLNREGFAPLHYASMYAGNDVARILLPISEINRKTSRGFTPIMIATWYENVDVVSLLLKQGAKCDDLSDDGWGSLHYATWKGNLVSLQKFIDQKDKFNYDTKGGLTIIDIALLKGNSNLAKQLIGVLNWNDRYQELKSKVDMTIGIDLEEGLPRVYILRSGSKIIFDNLDKYDMVRTGTFHAISNGSEGVSESRATAQVSVEVNAPVQTMVAGVADGFFEDDKWANRISLSMLDRASIEQFQPSGVSRFRGYSGEYFQSMAEMMVSNLLFVLGFRFEYRRLMPGTVKLGERVPSFTFYDKNGDVMIWVVNDFSAESQSWQRDFLWYQGNGFNYEVNFFATFNNLMEFDCLELYRVASLLKEHI